MDKIGTDGVKAELIENGYSEETADKYLDLMSQATNDAAGVRRKGEILAGVLEDGAAENLAQIMEDVYKRQLFSIYRGKGDERALKSSIAHACGLILAVTLVLNAVVYIFIDPILSFLRVPEEVWGGMREYLLIIFAGLLATSLYNFCLLYTSRRRSQQQIREPAPSL